MAQRTGGLKCLLGFCIAVATAAGVIAWAGPLLLLVSPAWG
jgi:hypothetical protein